MARASQSSQSKRSSKGTTRPVYKRQRKGYTPQYTQYTELTKYQRACILRHSAKYTSSKASPLYRDISQRDPNKRCEYQNDIGHTTNECKNLKDEIENLIRLAHLYEWIKSRLPHLNPILAGGHCLREERGVCPKGSLLEGRFPNRRSDYHPSRMEERP
uniref:Uncharacterized protein n=1 Tax=Cannabis sativa TaxID=3483 RepID=A0A803NIH4_CANSA